MKQADLGLGLSTKRTRKREFLDEMNRVVPWAALVELVSPYAPEGKRGRPPFPVETMLRIHFMQQWFTLSDPTLASTDRRTGTAQGRHPRQGRSPVPGDQAAVRACEGALPRVEEEHRAAHDLVRAVQPVDGAWQVVGGAGMSASTARETGLDGRKSGASLTPNALASTELAVHMTCSHKSISHARLVVHCSGCPSGFIGSAIVRNPLAAGRKVLGLAYTDDGAALARKRMPRRLGARATCVLPRRQRCSCSSRVCPTAAYQRRQRRQRPFAALLGQGVHVLPHLAVRR